MEAYYPSPDIIQLPTIGPTRNTAICASKIEYVELNANPIQGCSHACRYCYARKIDLRFGKVKSKAQWHNPKFFVNFFEILEKEIFKGNVDKDKEIFMSTMTDLYQPYSVKHGISRKLIEMVQDAGLKYRLLTKSPDVISDKDLHSGYKSGKVGLSITTNSSNEKERKHWEPRTTPIKNRLDTLKELDKIGGINLWVSAEPFLPKTDFEAYYNEIIEYGGDSLTEIVIGKMNYEAGIDELFNWEEVVKISEKFRIKFLGKIRFHYKKEFMNYLIRKNLTPWELTESAESEFCNYRQS